MRFQSHSAKLSSCLMAISAFVSGCGTQSTPLTEVVVEDVGLADNSEPSTGLPLLAVPGPGKGNSAKTANKVQPAAATSNPGSKSGPTLLPKGSNTKPANLSEPEPEPRKLAEEGSPEWLLNEIQRVRLMPLPQEEPRNHDEDEEDLDADEQPLTAEQEKKLALEIARTKGIRRERNAKIIKLAEECIQKTNQHLDQEPMFSAAVHHLLDARLQLALQGDAASIEALYEAAKVFFERNPKSDAASESALTLVNLTHANALRFGRTDARWLKEFSKHAQVYAARFPEESPRSVPLLMAAGRSCEMNGQPEEARTCYSLLNSKFKETPQGQQAAGILRRLQIKGQELELSGPCIDGNEIDVQTMKGKMVLIVFWASNAQPFTQQAAKIAEVSAKYRQYCQVVGVNLDTEEKAVEAFVEKYQLDWPQIFAPSRSQRGWNSPLATHFGVYSLPTIWLLDPNGIVVETNLDASNLEAKLREVYKPFLNRKKEAKK